jgi:hypothetical protein
LTRTSAAPVTRPSALSAAAEASRSAWLRAWACFCVLAVAVLVAAVGADQSRAATAGTAYGSVASFGDTELYAGFAQTSAVGVDPATGNILVADSFQGIRVYAPDPALGGTLLTTFFAPAAAISLAIDPTNGDVFVLAGDGLAHKFVSDGASTPTYTEDPSFAMAPGAIADPYFDQLAVDPGTHEVVVTDPPAIRRFSPTGALVSSFTGADTAAGAFTLPHGIAIAPNGDIYVTEGTGTARLERFNRAGTSLRRVVTTGDAVAVAVNQATGDLLVGEDLNVGKRPLLEGFSSSGTSTFISQYPVSATGAINRGLAVDSNTGRVYAGAEAGFVASVHVFDSALQPGVDAPTVSQLSQTSAHLATDVAPGGVSTDAHFEYCPASSGCEGYRFSDPTDPNNPWIALPDHTGLASDTTIEDDLTGLDPNKQYRVRAYASNGVTVNVSPSATFTTLVAPPMVTTDPASEVNETDAALNGKVDPRGAQTTYYFEYGTTTDYGSRTPQNVDGIAGSGRLARPFTRNISGLTPGTPYHFRLVAQNSAGTSFGADQTFTTDAEPTSPARAYEQVTPVNKAGGALNPVYGFHAKADGSAIEYGMAAAPQGAPSSVMVPRILSRRGATDWLDWNFLDPPLGVTRTLIGSATLAVSADFTRILVATNRKLTADATEGAANMYVKDIDTSTYAFVGSSTASGALRSMLGPQRSANFIAGAPDFSWMIVAAAVPLLPGAPEQALYRWTSANGLSLQSLLPGNTAPAGDLVQLAQATQGPARLVSDDGSVTAFALESGDDGVYRRADGQTTALSVSRIAGDPATPLPGRVEGVSRDGDAVVFVSGRLLPEAPVGNDNLYRYRASTDSLTYLGTLLPNSAAGSVMGVGDDANTVYFNDGENTSVWHDGVVRAVTPEHPEVGAYPSANGRFLVWAGADGDVHRYDAQANGTVCVSCLGSGSPGGGAFLSDSERNISNRRPLVVNDQGVVYFTTTTRLLTADRNGSRDVYAYANGEVTLISPGDGEFDATFAEASESGNDVFFTTTQGIVAQDVDGEPDIYDARVGGGFEVQNLPPPAACRKATCGPTGPATGSPVVEAPTTSTGPPEKAANRVGPRMSLRKVTFTSRSMRITFTASQRGRVRVTGSRVAITVRRVGKAGTYSMTVPLSKKARRLKRAHRRFRLTAKVTLTGGRGTASIKINRTLRG